MTPSNLVNHPIFASLPLAPVEIGIAAAAFLLFFILLPILITVRNRRRRSRVRASASRAPQQVLDTRLLATPRTSPESLQGGLKHMPLPDLLQFLAQGRRTGTLELTSGRRGGLIRLVQGMVVHAEYRRTEDLDALYGLLSMETGDFVFTPTTAPDYQVSGREVVDILMLWLSRKDGHP